MHRKAVTLLVVALAGVAGCGESKSDKALADVCAARDDITHQVDHLKSMTLTTATKNEVTDTLQSIRDDLATIGTAQQDLSDERRKDVQAANDAFRKSVRDTLQTVGSSTSVEQASTQLKAAFQELGASYRRTFGTLDCS